jgi:hypothetical protein
MAADGVGYGGEFLQDADERDEPTPLGDRLAGAGGGPYFLSFRTLASIHAWRLMRP